MKKYDVVARVGSYIDQSGQEKGKFENIGAVIQNQNGGFNLLLKKTFNPAGLAEPGQESIILSLFEPQAKEHGNAQAKQSQRNTGYDSSPVNQKQPNPKQTDPVNDFDDDIPF